MDNLLNYLVEITKDDMYIIGLTLFCILLFILYLANIVKLKKIRKEYKKFLEKLGNGSNIEDILNNHLNRINKVITKNEELEKYCIKLDTDIKYCIQKIGIYRYNAYKDTGSDLSFTLALLNEKNDGVVLNGIYSRDMSNIYAKPIKGGISEYKITEEENEAIKRAINVSDSIKDE